ncbi:ATP-binding protein [Streptomyces hokutonensis]|uniref:ATP-binding protein n=1 Tax=Streptomyces hokutonensis TaxID=1306990 RepID=UPI000378C172|nr:ATP-binding protein [Streptomyces hokutonensis]
MNATHFEAALLAVPKAVPELRHAVRGYLGGDGPHPEVELCVSELVSNVIRHVGEGTPVRVRVTRVGGVGGVARVGPDGDRIRVEVADPDPRALPVLLDATTDTGLGAESGRGLMLLDAVAVRWGVEQGVSGKVVWCEVRAPASPAPASSRK